MILHGNWLGFNSKIDMTNLQTLNGFGEVGPIHRAVFFSSSKQIVARDIACYIYGRNGEFLYRPLCFLFFSYFTFLELVLVCSRSLEIKNRPKRLLILDRYSLNY